MAFMKNVKSSRNLMLMQMLFMGIAFAGSGSGADSSSGDMYGMASDTNAAQDATDAETDATTDAPSDPATDSTTAASSDSNSGSDSNEIFRRRSEETPETGMHGFDWRAAGKNWAKNATDYKDGWPCPSEAKGAWNLATLKTLSSQVKGEWILAHNYYRCLHGMGPVKWSNKGKRNLQEHLTANGCVMEHSDSKNEDPPAGQNLASGTSNSHVSPHTSTRGWYNEIVDYDFAGGDLAAVPAGKEILHFTAMLWKDVAKIGCYKCSGASSKVSGCNYVNVNATGPLDVPNVDMPRDDMLPTDKDYETEENMNQCCIEVFNLPEDATPPAPTMFVDI